MVLLLATDTLTHTHVRTHKHISISLFRIDRHPLMIANEESSELGRKLLNNTICLYNTAVTFLSTGSSDVSYKPSDRRNVLLWMCSIFIVIPNPTACSLHLLVLVWSLKHTFILSNHYSKHQPFKHLKSLVMFSGTFSRLLPILNRDHLKWLESLEHRNPHVFTQ